jgi:hypothetical protein
MFFKDTEEGKEWFEFGIKELAREIRCQILPDGVDFESSIYYNRLVTELFGYSAILCKLNNVELPGYFWDTLRKMFDFVAHYLKPDGKAPQIGDNDNGRLLVLTNYAHEAINEHGYLFNIAHQIWPDYRRVSPISKDFPQGGYYIMRKTDYYMIISAGEVGTNGIGNHKHNDIFSFELQVKRQDIIVDPGTYLYTVQPQWRNRFRSTFYHNTVVVDNKEINYFRNNELFRMHENARPRINAWRATDEYDFFDGEHYGYRRLKNPVMHRRQVYFDKKNNYWVIKDILTGKGEHNFKLYFHFAPIDVNKLLLAREFFEKAKSIRNPLLNEDFYIDESLVVETRRSEGANLLVMPVITSDGLSLEIEDGWVSYSYGIMVKAPVARYMKSAVCPTEFVTILYSIP